MFGRLRSQALLLIRRMGWLTRLLSLKSAFILCSLTRRHKDAWPRIMFCYVEIEFAARNVTVIKIGAMVVSGGRYVAFQMAEVAILRQMFQEILRLIAKLRPLPRLAPE